MAPSSAECPNICVAKAKEVIEQPQQALSLLTSLQKVFGGEDSGGLKARRRALSRLRQQKFLLRRSSPYYNNVEYFAKNTEEQCFEIIMDWRDHQ